MQISSARWFGVIAAAVGFALAASAAHGTTIAFSDSFTPNASPLWNDLLGGWAASNGDYLASSPFSADPGPGTYSGLPYDLTDLSITVNVNDLADGGVWLHSDGTSQNGVLLVTGGNGYGEGVRGGDAGTSLYWAVVQNGVGTGMGLATGVFTPGDNYTLTVTVVGDVYSAYVDGSPTPTSVLANGAFPSGEVGLYDDQPGPGGSGPPQSFSDFELQGTAVPEPASIVLFGIGVIAIACTAGRRIGANRAAGGKAGNSGDTGIQGTPYIIAVATREISMVSPDSREWE